LHISLVLTSTGIPSPQPATAPSLLAHPYAGAELKTLSRDARAASWVTGLDILVAAGSGHGLLAWFELGTDAPPDPVTVAAADHGQSDPGDVGSGVDVGVLESGGGAQTRDGPGPDAGDGARALPRRVHLDGAAVAVACAVREGRLVAAMRVLDTEAEAEGKVAAGVLNNRKGDVARPVLWRAVLAAALAELDLAVAARSLAALGDVAGARFIRRLAKAADGEDQAER
jgi:hypothetical protein